MATTAQAAFGIVLSWDSAGGTSYTTIAKVVGVNTSGYSTTMLDASAHDSTSGHMEFLVGLVDGGEVTFDLRFDPNVTSNEHENLAASQAARPSLSAVPAWKILWPDASSNWTFDAYVQNIDTTGPHDDGLGASLTIKITGVITRA